MNHEKSDTVRRWYDEVWNNNNESAIHELMHTEANAFGLGANAIIGPAGFKPFYDEFKNAYSAIHVTVDKTLVDGDHVTAMCTVTATHKQTGNPVKFSGVSVTTIQNGQITCGWNYFDFLTLNLQIGKITPEQLI
ncbi:MAG TPA: ester cyclase [Mucilaginibacter sp.]|nr:ester cyclase [Mucilaginibacter sp.]